MVVTDKVAVLAPAVVGLNVVVTAQLAPLANEDVLRHVPARAVKSPAPAPDKTGTVNVAASGPPLVSVTVSVVLVSPTKVVGAVTVEALQLKAASTLVPCPLIVIALVVGEASVVSVNVS